MTTIALSLPPEVLVLGAVSGLGYGLAAAALVLALRLTGTPNLALGQIGAFAAVLLVWLIDRDLPWLVAFPLALAAAGVIGAGLELGVLRRLRDAPPLVALAATLGAAQALLPLTLELVPEGGGGTAFPQPPVVPDVEIGVLTLLPGAVTLAILAPLLALSGAYVLRRTQTGAALRLAAADPDGARALGIDVGRLATATAAMAAVAAALSAGLDPAGGQPAAAAFGPGLLVRLLGAAAIARFTSLPIALAAGVGIGVGEQVLIYNDGDAALVAPAILVVVLLRALVASGPPERLSNPSAWLLVVPRGPRADRLELAVAAVVLGAMALAPVVFEAGDLLLATTVVAGGLIVLSAWVGAALAGVPLLGQAGIAGVGAAVATGTATTTGSALAGFAAAAVVGAVLLAALALPQLRERGALFAASTLAFGIAAEGAILNAGWVLGEDPAPARLTDDPDVAHLIAVGVLATAYAATTALTASRAGRKLRAARDDDRAARALGLPAAALRLRALAVSGAIAGLGGALLAQPLTSAQAGAFPAQLGLDVAVAAAVGGLGAPLGALLGTLAILAPPALGLVGVGSAALAAAWVALLTVSPGGLVALIPRLEPRERERPAAPPQDEEDQAEPGPRVALEAVTKRFGDLAAVDDMSLAIEPGETVALLGPNGAGKTTVLDLIAGVHEPDCGRVLAGTEDVTEWPAHERSAALGIVRLAQEARSFPTLSVGELALLGAERDEPIGIAAGLVGRPATPVARARAAAALEWAGMGPFARRGATELSTGQRRAAELACVLAARPRILLLDEPSAGLALAERPVLSDLLRRLAAEARGPCVLVEHDERVAAAVAGRVVRMPGPAAEPVGAGIVADGDRVQGFAVDLAGLEAGYGGQPALRVGGLVIAPGELVALVGANGAGKTTLLRVLAGLLRPTAGRALVGDVDAGRAGAVRTARSGVMLVSGTRPVANPLSVATMLELARPRGQEYRPSVWAQGVRTALERFPGVGRRLDTPVAALSTGERAQLGMVTALARRPRLLLVDELSLGLASDAAAGARSAVTALAREGATVVVADQHSAALLETAPRGVLIDGGRVVADGPSAEIAARPELASAQLIKEAGA